MGKTEVEDYLTEYIQARQEAVADKKKAEVWLKELDDQIKVLMIQHEVGKFEHDGTSMKVANGINKTIIEKELIRALSQLGWNPDHIKGLLKVITKVTPYDYIDMRRVAVEKEEESNGSEG